MTRGKWKNLQKPVPLSVEEARTMNAHDLGIGIIALFESMRAKEKSPEDDLVDAMLNAAMSSYTANHVGAWEVRKVIDGDSFGLMVRPKRIGRAGRALVAVGLSPAIADLLTPAEKAAAIRKAKRAKGKPG